MDDYNYNDIIMMVNDLMMTTTMMMMGGGGRERTIYMSISTEGSCMPTTRPRPAHQSEAPEQGR